MYSTGSTSSGQDLQSEISYSEYAGDIASSIVSCCEPLAAQLSKRRRLAHANSIPLADLEHETLLLFPRELAPAYYDRIMQTCELAGFQPQVRAFPKPPVNAMLARLLGHMRLA